MFSECLSFSSFRFSMMCSWWPHACVQATDGRDSACAQSIALCTHDPRTPSAPRLAEGHLVITHHKTISVRLPFCYLVCLPAARTCRAFAFLQPLHERSLTTDHALRLSTRAVLDKVVRAVKVHQRALLSTAERLARRCAPHPAKPALSRCKALATFVVRLTSPKFTL